MQQREERYGYRVSGGEYVFVETEQAVIRRLREVRESGASWNTVADWLNALATAEPPQGTLWNAAMVERIYGREFGIPAVGEPQRAG